ncbi:hypothetical protein CHCC14809_0357 [Bacillus licheniformis]|nr:hypothetical protein B4090_3045 [Bacillus licheniformis]TWN15870.1 hypothetical protein CHCC14564_0435 [Bacillus licheniformis LMG 17339]OLF90484.1 hypothetical protein B4089_2809 [Bacillus licheniformis]OLF92053.1 hypothetical protein B4094_2830 [Bacillus licheniformis]OLG09663.1 hypothetical protein B4124_0307 [Bacillus licheniformis]
MMGFAISCDVLSAISAREGMECFHLENRTSDDETFISITRLIKKSYSPI